MTLSSILRHLGACKEGLRWAADRTPEEAWETCPNGSHLLWVCARVGVDQQLLVSALCDVVEPTLRHIPESSRSPHRELVESLREFSRGEATIDVVRAARKKAAAATAYDSDVAYDTDAAAYAADATDAAAAYATDASAYAYAAAVHAAAADAAAYTAAVDVAANHVTAYGDSLGKSQRESAELIRSRITYNQIWEAYLTHFAPTQGVCS